MELPDLPDVMQWKQGYIPVTYESIAVDMSLSDAWPSYFCCMPKVGDLVQATNGRRLAIKDIIHCVENNTAVLKIALGKDTGTQHAEAGVGGEEDW